MNELKKASATWRTSLNIECPHCEHYFDLEDYPDSFEWIYPVSSKTVNQPVTCPKCHIEFIVEDLER